jgi:hypothetical protein
MGKLSEFQPETDLEPLGTIAAFGRSNAMFDARTIARLRFPSWQVYELQGGYAVEDAEGRRLGTFYGKADPVEAREAGLLTLEEARQTAFNFARLVELLNEHRETDGPRSPAAK